MENLKYPIKYALMPIIKQVGWSTGIHQMEREYNVVTHIVSKAYIISKTIKYHSDGSKEKLFNVVFPYDNLHSFDIRSFPKYNINGECLNSLEVSEIFETYEQAVEARKLENRKLRCHCYSVSKAKQFDEDLKKYIKLEEFILWNTNEMIISEEKQECKTYKK